MTSTTSFAEDHFSGKELLDEHCSSCHDDSTAEGDFRLSVLYERPQDETLEQWLGALDRVTAGEMPPPEDSELDRNNRAQLATFLRERLRSFRSSQSRTRRPRRLNNREFRNSIRDVLMIEDIGTHQPTDNLIGDTLHHGFDTHGDSLGFSKFHLEQYIRAVRAIVDGTILSGARPKPLRYEIRGPDIIAANTSQNTKRPERHGKTNGFDFLDPAKLVYFQNFKTAPATGYYRIKIRCTGMDRGVYDAAETGVYDEDPIQLAVQLGDRTRTIDLPDEEVIQIELKEWIAAGSRLRLRHPTDGLRNKGNGNFKFQNAITGAHIKQHDPERYAKIVAAIAPPKPGRRTRRPESWHHWVDYWRGPRPRIFDATIEGPIFDAWPPKRQVALLGENPTVDRAREILSPIAERAWRRELQPDELQPIVDLVESMSERGDVEALKEGIVAILVSPQFLMLNQTELTSQQRFASRLSYFLQSSIPDPELRVAVEDGELNSFEGVREEVRRQIKSSKAASFFKSVSDCVA